MNDKDPVHDIELPFLPPLRITPSVEPIDYPEVAKALMDYARAAVEADRKRRERDLVAKLIEALTELCDEIDRHEIHTAISETNISWFKRKAREVLAAMKGE